MGRLLDRSSHTVTAQRPLWDRLYIKYAYSRARIEERNDNDRTDDGLVNESLSHRLRFMLLY